MLHKKESIHWIVILFENDGKNQESTIRKIWRIVPALKDSTFEQTQSSNTDMVNFLTLADLSQNFTNLVGRGWRGERYQQHRISYTS